MVRVILVAWIGAVGLLSWPLAAVHAQPASRGGVTTSGAEARPLRPRTALQQGIDYYMKGEYETAEPLLRIAEAARQQLSPAEQAKLSEYLKKNGEATQARFQALEQLSKADEAIKTGRYQDADPLLKALKSSRYLNAQERQMVNSLSDEYKQKSPRRSWWPSSFMTRRQPAADAVARPDADALLADAQRAFEQKDYDRAEVLARESEAAGFHAIFPWSATPAKLLKEVQAARAKNPMTTPMTPVVAETKPGTLPAPRTGPPKQVPGRPNMAETVPAKPKENVDKKSGTARELLRQAHLAVEAGELVKARQLVRQAEDTKAHIWWWDEYTPDKLKNEIARAEQAGAKPAAAKPSTGATTSAQKPLTPAEVKALVKSARGALDDNQLDQAEDMARRARLVPGVKWGLFEDTPDKVMADVAKARESANSDRATAMLGEARKLFDKGQLDEAERLTYQAEALRSSYPIWHRGERPARLRAEIAGKRKSTNRPSLPPLLDPVAKDQPKKQAPPAALARTDSPLYGPPPPAAKAAQVAQADPRRQQAGQLMAQARANLNQGDYVTALNLAARVKSMNLTFLAGEDSPESIVAAVRALQNQQTARQNPQVAEASRKKALQHLADARLMMKEDRLLDALQAVQQAQQCGAVYQPNDDLPESVVAELKKAAKLQVEKYSAAAQTLGSYRRHEDAARYWGYVHQVGMAFQMDVSGINEKLAEARQLAGGAPAETPMPGAAPSVAAMRQEEDKGRELLAQAGTELKHGEIAQARKLAETLYTGAFNLKDEARRLLAQIDDAEYKQTVKRSELLYEQAVRAFMRKDYPVCASYLQSMDLKLLDERKRAHAQEIMASRELQPHGLVMTGVQEDAPHGRRLVSDQPPAKNEDAKPSLVDEVRKRQEIALQKLREQQLQSERDAGKLANQGDYAGAVRRLESAIAAVKESELDPELTAAMQRRLEQRLKQYNTMQEQVTFAELQKDKMNANAEHNRRKFIFEEHKREQVASLMTRYNDAFKAGKYKEAASFAMQAREIDPDNPAAEVAAFKADVMRNLANEKDLEHAKGQSFAGSMQDVVRASVTPGDSQSPVSYGPKEEWFEKKDKRKGKVALAVEQQSPKDRETENKLNTVVSVDFKNKPLIDALTELREMTDVNIVPDRQHIDLDGISLDQPVTLPLDRVQLRTALRLMLHNARLTYVINDGVIMVTTPLGAKGKLTKKIYAVADLVVPTDQYGPGDPINQLMAKNTGQDSPLAQSLSWRVNTSPGDGTAGYAPGAGMGSNAPLQPASMGHKSMVQILMELIQSTIEPGCWDNMGGSGHIEFYPVGMSLVVSQVTPDIQEQVQLLLDRLRELQQLQVTVEVRFITLSENFYERIGVDMDFQFNDNQTKFAKQVQGSAFAPPEVPNEPSHLDNVIVGLTPQGVFTNDLDIPVNVSSFERAALPSGFAGFPGQPGGNGGIDLGVAFLSSIEVFLFLEAAQGDVRSNVLTAPKITLFNGQTATISSSLTQFLVLQVIPIRDPLTGLITFFPVNTPVPSTTTLTVTAIVSADRRYVTLSLQPTITRVVNSSRTFSPVAGIVLQQPDIETLFVQTAVSVPDGGTILMGGLKTMNEQRLEFGPPILSKVPYINRLFRNQSFGREARSLMIMVTPRIIIPEEEEEKLGQTFAF